MRVFRRQMPNGKLSPTYYVHYEVDGKRVVKSTGCKTEREAMQVAKNLVAPLRQQHSARALVETHRQLLTGADTVPLVEAWERFATKPKAQATSEEQREANRIRWVDFVAFMAAQFPAVTHLGLVTRSHAEAYLTHVREHGRFQRVIEYKRGRHVVRCKAKERKLAGRSLNAIHDTCKMVFTGLAQDAGLVENPFAGVARLKPEYQCREAFTAA